MTSSTSSTSTTPRATGETLQPDGSPTANRDDTQQGDTRVAQSDQMTEKAVPRLPHERDQSADSQPRQAAGAKVQGEQAHGDATGRQQDTDKGPVMDKVYREEVQGGGSAGVDSAKR